MDNTKYIIPLIDEESGEATIPLSVFADIINISLVYYYTLDQSPMDRLLDEKSLTLKFYDKDGNLIMPFKK